MKLTEIIYNCSNCSYQTQWSFAYKSHVKRHYQEISTDPFNCAEEIEVYKCEECLMSANVKTSLTRHLQNGHRTAVNNSCHSFKGYLNQKVIDLQPEDICYNENTYVCHHCKLVTFSQIVMLKHLEFCHKLRYHRFKCSPLERDNIHWFPSTYSNFGGKSPSHGVHLASNKTEHDKTIRCSICNFTTEHPRHLKRHHIKEHTPNNFCSKNENGLGEKPKWFECTFCDYKTKLRKNLLQHRNRHSKKTTEWFKCRICNFKSNQIAQFQFHAQQHKVKTEAVWFKCKMCNFRTQDKSDLSKHNSYGHYEKMLRPSKESDLVLNRINDSDNETEWFQCKMCNFRSKDQRDLSKHNGYGHCEKMLNNSKENNNQVLNQISESENDTKWFKCKMCNFRSMDKRDLSKHNAYGHYQKILSDSEVLKQINESENETTWFQCALCSFKSLQSSVLKQHHVSNHVPPTNMRNGKTEFKEQDSQAVIGRISIRKNTLGKEYKFYECSQCDYGSAQTQCLKRHIISKHTPKDQINWFKCSVCDFKSKRKDHLKEHFNYKHINIKI